MIRIRRDSKGPCWVISHKRAGVTETFFLTEEECLLLRNMLNLEFGYGQ